jgi:hypothetical protein
MAQPSLDALTVTPKTGDDRFTHQGQDIGANLLGFWRWACSDLVGNVMRGVLAEYIVGLALECVNGARSPPRRAALPSLSGRNVPSLRAVPARSSPSQAT